MWRMDIEVLYRRKHTSWWHPAHAMLSIYVPMKRGFVYLAAVIDWTTRHALAWRLSNRLTADFCIEVVEEAIARYGSPEMFNTDQGVS